MENYEVIFIDLHINCLDKLLFQELSIDRGNIRSSHFHDTQNDTDLELSSVKNLKDLMNPRGSGTIVLDTLDCGVLMKNVVIVLSFENQYGDVLINFPRINHLRKQDDVVRLLEYVMDLQNRYNVPEIRLGYEPVLDDDTCLITIKMNQDVDLDSAVKEIIA